MNNISQNLENLQKSFKNKEKNQEVLLKDINNYQELITQITNNNKIIEENFKLNLVSLDLRSLGLTLNKKPRPTQKSSFLDFISKRKNLEAKKFKLKMKYSETQLNRKQQILKLSSKMKNSRDSFKSSLL
jgi:hypothetical protein